MQGRQIRVELNGGGGKGGADDGERGGGQLMMVKEKNGRIKMVERREES